MSLPENKSSLLDSASRCMLLHRGGEADVFLVCLESGDRLTLKWYRQPFDIALVEKVQKIKDDGICRIRETGFFQDNPYQLYDFIEGVSSESLNILPLPVAISAARMLVSSLKNALRVGASHGDLTPSNVIVTLKDCKGGRCFQPVLIDWGISGPGALAFAAPERFKGEQPDEKSDIFSLGLLLFRWISGENLVEAHHFDEFASKISQLDLKSVSEKLFLSGKFSSQEISSLEPLWKACLQADPEDRAEDLDELDELLEIVLDQVGGGEIARVACFKKFVEEIAPQIEKMGRKVSSGLDDKAPDSFPFKKVNSKGRKKTLKIAILGLTGLLIVVLLILFANGTDGSGVDETGKMFLENSRSLESETMNVVDDSVASPVNANEEQVKEILDGLPTPSKEQ